MKIDVADGNSGSQRHAERLNRAIKILVIERVFIVPDSRRRVGHFEPHEPNSIVTRIWFDLAHRRGRRCPGLDGGFHSHCAPDSCKREMRGAGDIELTVGGIVKHVAFSRMRLAPRVLLRTKVSGFAKVRRTRILCCVQVADINSNPVRHPVVVVPVVVVGARWKGSGEGIDPSARTDAALVAIQA